MSTSLAETRAAEIRAGIFVLVVGIFSFVTLLYVGSSSLFVRGEEYVAEFVYSGILEPGARVRFEGVEIGTVTKISFNPKTSLVEVALRIKNTSVLPERFIAIIETEGMLGQPYIALTARLNAPAEYLTRADSLVAAGPDGVKRIAGLELASLAVLLAKGSEMLDKGIAIMDTAGEITSGVHSIVTDPETKRRIMATLANAEAAASNFAQTGADASEIAARFRERTPAILNQVDQTLQGAERATIQAAALVEENRPNIREAIFNARVASLGIAEAPWRLVWKDDRWVQDVTTGRAQERSLRAYDTTAVRAATTALSGDGNFSTRPRSSSYGSSFDPTASRE